MNYLDTLSENAQMNRENTNKSNVLPYEMLNMYLNCTVTKVILTWAHNQMLP